MTNRRLLAVDGNSLLHRAYHALATTGLSTRDGRPTWAVKGFCSLLLAAVERTGASALVVGFDDHTSSVRKTAHPHYKATRKPKPPELGQQIGMTIELLRAAGLHVVVPAGLEADDVLASAARTAAAAGWDTVIVTSDRDSFALIDDTTSVLRIINGGVEASPVLTPDRLRSMYGIAPQQYREYAAMRGDTSDNLTGIMGIGEKTGARLLELFPTVAEAFADVDDNGGAKVATIGKALVKKLASPENREAFWRNVEIMTMRTDIELGLGLTDAGAGCLPVDADRLTAAFDALELNSVRGAALRLLTRPLAAPAARFDEPPADVFGEPPADMEPPADVFVPAMRAPAQPAVVATTVTGAMPGSTAARPARWDDTLL